MGGTEHCLRHPPPLGSLVVEPVHGEHDLGRGQVPGQRRHHARPERVIVDDIVAGCHRGHCGSGAVHDRVQVFGAHRGRVRQSDTAMLPRAVCSITGSAVGRHRVSHRGQPGCQFLHVVLNATEGGGHSLLADHRDTQPAPAGAVRGPARVWDATGLLGSGPRLVGRR
jgi:hypothetical protein